MEKEDILQCLTDARCTDKAAEKIMGLLEKDNPKAAMQLMQTQRRALLDQLHDQQKCIDCLDYLTYQMNQEEKGERIRKGTKNE